MRLLASILFILPSSLTWSTIASSWSRLRVSSAPLTLILTLDVDLGASYRSDKTTRMASLHCAHAAHTSLPPLTPALPKTSQQAPPTALFSTPPSPTSTSLTPTPLWWGRLQSLPPIDGTTLTDIIMTKGKSTLTIFSTYPSDFNAIEYTQRLKHYLPRLEEKGVENFNVIINGPASSVEKHKELLSMSDLNVNFIPDPTGAAGRAFGASTGWRPDDDKMSPYFKLYMMLFGFGCWATLPAVIGGYIGNPFKGQGWVESAMRENCVRGYFPTNGLELDSEGNVAVNKYAEIPVVGEWPRRPFELATLRLQNMVGISFKHWKELAPSEDNLNVLTQLGGCVVLDGEGVVKWEFRDRGICDVANFEDMIDEL